MRLPRILRSAWVDSIGSGVLDYSKVPGPRPLPLLGNNWRFLPYLGTYKLSELDRVSQSLQRKYGPIVRISNLLGRPDMVFLFDPEEIERVFRSEDLLPFRPSMPSLDYYKHVLRKDFFANIGGVIATHGEKWAAFRTKVQQPMLQPRISQLYIGPIQETADEFVNRIRLIMDDYNEVPDDFLNEIHKWSLESLARVALDVKLGCLSEGDSETQELIHAVATFFKDVVILELKIPFWRLFPTPTWKEFIASLDTIIRVSNKHINEALERIKGREECKDDTSILERVLLQNPDNPKFAVILALDLFLVGIDTTSAAISSVLYQLSKHQDKQDVLAEEVNRVIGDEPITMKNLDQMPYLKAFVKETLRLYPVVIGNGRCLTKETVICGYKIPIGTQIVFQHHAIGNSCEHFDAADEFIPERWLKGKEKIYHPFASLPFGFGKRMCLGKRFADLEMQCLIAKVPSATTFNVAGSFTYKSIWDLEEGRVNHIESSTNFTSSFGPTILAVLMDTYGARYNEYLSNRYESIADDEINSYKKVIYHYLLLLCLIQYFYMEHLVHDFII